MREEREREGGRGGESRRGVCETLGEVIISKVDSEEEMLLISSKSKVARRMRRQRHMDAERKRRL